MKFTSLRRSRSPVAPKPLSVGGFTLIEIMIVVSVVAILSWLGMVAIGRVKEHAARSLIANTLRQIYQAKEFYYTETGGSERTDIDTLVKAGYLKKSVYDQVYVAHTFESGMGWKYDPVCQPGKPVSAYKGLFSPSMDPTKAGEVIWYPAAPTGAAAPTTPVAPAPATPASTPAVRPAPPAAPATPPSNPLAPIVAANPVAFQNPLPDIGVSEQSILQSLGAASPDGTSPIKILKIEVPGLPAQPRSIPRNGTTMWMFHLDRTATGASHPIRVTLDNGHGQTVVEAHYVH